MQMSDAQLRGLGLKYGDVIALQVFVRTRSLQSTDTASLTASSSEQRRASLVDRLQGKISQHRSKRAAMSSNRNAIRSQRRVELGWLNYEKSSKKYVQVRPHKGGGIRHVVISTSARAPDILACAKQLYFPGGVSSKGDIDDFEMKLMNVEQVVVNDSDDIAAMYARTCVPLLRLYLATQQATVGVCNIYFDFILLCFLKQHALAISGCTAAR